MFRTAVVEKIKTYILYSITFFFENRAFYEVMGKKTLQSRTGHRWRYGAGAMHAGYL